MEPQIIGFAGILVANLVAAFDAAALSVSLPTIATDLNATNVEIYWAGTAFVLSSAACQPLFPAFSNALGRRPMTLFALLALIVGTIVCGTAIRIPVLLAGRTVQGIGGGGILAMTYTVMTDLFNLRQRSTAIAINGLVWLLGTALGPVLGGLFSSHVNWRWIFWICLPLLGIATILVFFFLRPEYRANTYASQSQVCACGKYGRPYSAHEAASAGRRENCYHWSQIDWFGAGLMVASLVAFLMPVSWGGVLFPWKSWNTLVPLVLGSVGLLTWFAYERLVPENPIMPLDIFNNWTTAAALFGTFIIGIIQFGLIFYLPLYYQVVKGYSPTDSGLAILPVTLVSGLSTAIVGIIISKSGRYRLAVLLGWAILALGSGLLELLGGNTIVPQWIFITAVSGLGGGILFTALAIASQSHVVREHIAIAAALTPFVRAIGQAIGITAGNSVLQNQFLHRLASSPNESLRQNAAFLAQHLASPAVLSSFTSSHPSDAGIRPNLLTAYNASLRDFWWFLLAAALLGGLCAMLVRDTSLDQQRSASGAGNGTSAVTKTAADLEAGRTSHPPKHHEGSGLKDYATVVPAGKRQSTSTLTQRSSGGDEDGGVDLRADGGGKEGRGDGHQWRDETLSALPKARVEHREQC